MPKPLFFLRSFNDIDHIVPVIWKFQEYGEKPIIVFTSKISYEDDYRLRFIESNGRVEMHRFLSGPWDKLRRRIASRLTEKWKVEESTIRRFLWSLRKEKRFLSKNNVYTCIFEWGDPQSRGPVTERFICAAKANRLATFSVPHGCNIYLNTLVNQRDIALNAKGVKQDMSARNVFDYYVVQSPRHRAQSLRMGLDPDRCQAWGSARFYPEWQKINLKICGKFIPQKDDGGKTKVIFMLPHWDYNVHRAKCMTLIERLVNRDNIFLIIKDHTRGRTGGLTQEERKRFEAHPNVETDVRADSPALIAWSDAVINFGSSIGIEVLLQDKVLINPLYLHTNRTIFEETGAAVNAHNDEEVLSTLAMIGEGRGAKIPDKNRDKLYREIIYGGKEPFDVLDYYYQRLSLSVNPSAR